MKARVRGPFGSSRRPVNVLGALVLVGLASALAACSGSEGTGPETQTPGPMAAFAGTWDATSFVHTAKTDANLVVDIIAAGTSFVLVITEAGQYTATATLAGQSQVETGTIRQVGTQLILAPVSPPGPEGPVNFTLLGNVMTWDGDSEWDFSSDGIPEITSVRIVYQKR